MKTIWATFEFFTSDMELSLPKFSETYSISTLVSRAPKLANFFLKFYKWRISQSQRLYRPHYSNPIFNVQRQFCPVILEKHVWTHKNNLFLVFGPLKFEIKLFFKVFFQKQNGHHFPKKYSIFIFIFFCKIDLVSNHLWKKTALYDTIWMNYWTLKMAPKTKKIYGGQFLERCAIFGWLYLGNSK